MLLSELLERLDAAVISGDPDATEITGVVYDSRKAEKGSLFVCVEGANSDGHDYLADVAAKGAAAVLVRRGHALPDPLPEQ